jgi:hypothetical protein
MAALWDLLGDSLVRAMSVVVPDVAAKDTLEMPCVHDQEMVEALGSDRPHEPLGVGVRVRGPERSLQDLGTLRSKDLVEAGHVLRVAVADEELGRDPSSTMSPVTFLACWVTHARMGVGGDAGDPHLRRPSSMKNRT